MIPMPSMLTIQKFYVSTIEHLEVISSTLGPNEVCFICQDDKARVPIGLTAANKQSPLLMHVEYRVSLPDHDWVVAAQHKLIPSVYTGIVIQPNGLGKPELLATQGQHKLQFGLESTPHLLP